MPWVSAALQMIKQMLVGTPGRAALTGVGAGTLLDDIPIIGGIFGGGGDGGGGGQPVRRRRRRRALTASDRADIGFITGLLGPNAGKNFAVTLAARGR